MNALPFASLALALALSGCASDKYYDLGFKIGASSNFAENWAYFEKMNPFFGDGLKKSFDQICEEFFDFYAKENDDESFAFPTFKQLDSLLQGCRNGYEEATPP